MASFNEELGHDARVQHIAQLSSTLLPFSQAAAWLPQLLQQDATARDCITAFLDGKGNWRRAERSSPVTRSDLQSHMLRCPAGGDGLRLGAAGSSALLVCLEHSSDSLLNLQSAR